MLKKNYRLSSVRLVNPKNISGSLFTIKIQRNNLEHSRFAFVISKKIDKRAVVRNSLKRKLSVTIEEIFDRIEGGNDFVFYPRGIVLEAPRERLAQELEIMLKKEGLMR